MIGHFVFELRFLQDDALCPMVQALCTYIELVVLEAEHRQLFHESVFLLRACDPLLTAAHLQSQGAVWANTRPRGDSKPRSEGCQ